MKLWRLMVLAGLGLGLVGCGTDSTDSSAGGDGQGGSTARFAIQKGYLAVLDSTYLSTYQLDASDGSATWLDRYYSSRELETLFAYGEDQLFVGTTTGTLILKVADSGDLSLSGWVDHARSCDPVVADDQAMYVTLRNGNTTDCGGSDYDNHLMVYSMANIYSPQLTASFELDQPRGLALADDWLLVCHADGLMVYDVSDRLTPVAVQNFSEFACNDVIVTGTQVYITHDSGVSLLASDGVGLWLESEIALGD